MNVSSYLRAQADVLHTQWINTHKELLEVADSKWRSVLIEELNDIYLQAKEFLNLHEDDIHQIDAARLKHILARDVDSHIYLLRHKKPTTDPKR